ncbi:MAG: acetate kinase [Syntrophaceticus sp.]|nr:acetate kinase [Syntrophaceticus sp.]MDD3314055.1 acetate kinase [Syntrophaceticus sp.]MDD4359578.1 acetate kinase [Syntrophaceticus sp.]MDD4782986.1 acetate kinase [Syntrophaceticus sp.]HBG22385.1 propionate kinase [Peptococcaceae bacterium]
MKILVLNCGSSSAKYMVYDWDAKDIMCKGIVERVTIGGSFCEHEATGRDKVKIERDCPTHREAVELILELLVSPENGVLKDVKEIDAVGHRVVHGGEKFAKSVVIDDEVMKAFKELQDLAPLHNPANILGIEAAVEILPDVPHMAVMDTAWHQTMESPQYMYALPYEWYEKYKVRRYGFHGTSLLYVAKRAAVLLGKDPFDVNLVLLHVGNGGSANAVKKGISYDTSMGFTPQEGLVMGTRAGDFDAAVGFYMEQKLDASPKDMETIINKKSGLLGITGKYTDRRDVLEAAAAGDKRSELAFEMESYRLKKYIGSYAAALGGIDAVVWTAGVGEMAPDIRARAMEGLEFMGVKFDPEKNKLAMTRNSDSDISAADSKVKVFVIPTDEELVFVEDVVALLDKSYDIHTNFKYSFQDPGYRNTMRDEEFAKELKKKPEKAKAQAKIPG